MNKAILVGRLTKDPDMKYTQSGKAVLMFSLAVDRRDKDKTADFISCVAWDKTAEVMGKYCTKGQKIAIEGRIQTRNYEAQDGSKRYVTEVIVSNMEFVESKKQGQQPQDGEEEIPF